MLLQLTTVCNEGCSHCFVDAKPEGVHMSWDTLNATIAFIKGIPAEPMQLISSQPTLMSPVNMVISGGEFTEHPEFGEMIHHLANELPHMNFMLESNGSWLGDEAKMKSLHSVLDLTMVRVLILTSHRKYYPNYNRFMLNKDAYIAFGNDCAKEQAEVIMELNAENYAAGHDGPDKTVSMQSKIIFDPDWQDNIEIVRFGRGASLPPVREDKRTPVCPNCMQLITVAQEYPSLAGVLVSMEHRGMMTTPIFSAEGSIHNGYSHLCTRVGFVRTTPPKDLYELIRDGQAPCGKCGLNDRIPEGITRVLSQQRRFRAVEGLTT